MSQPSEHITEEPQSSHEESEYNSNLGTESEERSTASEEDTFLSIQYPSPPFFPTPYLCNWDFLDSERALKYIMKHFNLETIHKGLQLYPDVLNDPIYYSTYINVDHFNSLQCYINKSICKCNAILQIWSEHIARYIASDNINPLIVTCIVDILCSSPTMNTCSKKRNIAIQNPMEHLDDDSLNQQ